MEKIELYGSPLTCLMREMFKAKLFSEDEQDLNCLEGEK